MCTAGLKACWETTPVMNGCNSDGVIKFGNVHCQHAWTQRSQKSNLSIFYTQWFNRHQLQFLLRNFMPGDLQCTAMFFLCKSLFNVCLPLSETAYWWRQYYIITYKFHKVVRQQNSGAEAGRFYFAVLRRLSTNPKVKELLKSVHICQSYRKNKRGTFL